MHFRSVFHRKFTWLIFVILALVATLVVFRYFPQANSLVTIDITMNRDQAQYKAQEIAHIYSLGPISHYTAIIFDLEEDVRNYIELEAGGRESFEKMIMQQLYAPYTWQVRHFMPENTHEVIIIFTPDGKPYGFKEVIAETIPGAALDSSTARLIAEVAAQKWDISFDKYQLIESSQKTQESGRIDHTFTYEYTKAAIGEGRYRVQLVVSGDKLTTLKHVMYIPETFQRRYQEMRSANDGMASIAKVLVWFLYFFLCCLIGIFFLLRTRYILFMPALWWGISLALLISLSLLNYLPLMLFSYNTALSFYSFIASHIIQCITTFILYSCIYSLTIIIAESLTRKAFGQHVQLWQSWNRAVAPSASIVGTTVAGYLMVPLLLAYSTILYLTGNTLWGWWSPSDTLANPNILATYFPWFSPLANAFTAGFWEECLFRAVPLATAALIGKKIGRERLIITVTLVMQALIFGAAHADYPAQPSYVRIIELFVPFLGFGLIYLRYGLLPIIITHFLYDVVLMALPLFVSTAAGSLVNKSIIIFISSLPLLIVIIQILRDKKQFLHQVSPHYKNSAWQPSPQITSMQDIHFIASPLAQKVRYRTLLLGIASTIIWWFLLPHQDTPSMTMRKEQAIARADVLLQQKNIVLDKTWEKLAYICSPEHEFKYTHNKQTLCLPHNNEAHLFIWQHYKPLYHRLLKDFLLPPCWLIRYARFEGDLAARAEEYAVLIDNTGNLRRFQHTLSEAQPSNSLDEQQARLLAKKALSQELGIDNQSVTELSACSIQRPARKDWMFTFFDHTQQELPSKAARIAITISGTQITDTYRYIHVPENWLRTNQQRTTIAHTLTTLTFFLTIIFFIIVTILALQRWARYHLSIKPLVVLVSIWLINMALQLYNNSPLMFATLQTNQPVSTQLFILITKYLFPFGIITAFIDGIMAAYILHRKHQQTTSIGWYVAIGASCAMIYHALINLCRTITPSLGPCIVSSDSLATRLVWFGFTGTKLNTIIIMLLGFFMLIDVIKQLKRKNYYRTALLFILCSGFMIPSIVPSIALRWWLVECLITSVFIGLLYWFILTRDQLYIPFIVSFFFIIRLLQQTLINPFPGSFASIFMSSILLLGTAFMSLYVLHQHSSKDNA